MFDDLFKTKGLSFDRLHALLRLSEAGSLIKAADNDLGKQSRLSHQLRELSEYFGVDLTERAGKSIKLTGAGEDLVKLTREHLLTLQSFRNQAAKAIPTIRIAAGDSLLQSLLIPAVSLIRRPNNITRFKLFNLRTTDIIEHLVERRAEFGLLRKDAVMGPLQSTIICEQNYAVFVPQRLVVSRGMLILKDALLNCPHATIGGDGRFLKQLNDLATMLGGVFAPELVCDSIGQCVAAVNTGTFAAVLPVQSWASSAQKDCTVVEDPGLDILKREIVLAWHPRTLEVMGSDVAKIRLSLIDALKQLCRQPE